MSDVQENLLAGIPTAGELKDPREGDYPEASLSSPEIVEQSNGHAIKLTWSGLTDAQGRGFDFTERYTIPTSTSEDFIHRLFLGLVHALGMKPVSDREKIVADDDESRGMLLNAFEKSTGRIVSLRLSQDNKGYLRSKFLKR